MINYYEILGLANSATALEIKSAFRALAKLYHPDKNPLGKEQFSKILKAYEILSDPEAKLRYDYRLEYNLTQHKKSPSGHYDRYKDFEEKELKRRRYYDEHIKKHEKKTHRKKEAEPELKENYNEFKYILYATPLAVILFLLVVNLASNDRNFIQDLSNKKIETLQSGIITPTKNSMVVHSQLDKFELLGEGIFDEDSKIQLNIKNYFSQVIVLCIYNKQGEFIRKDILQSNSESALSNLPQDKLALTICILPKQFDTSSGSEALSLARFFKNKQSDDIESMKLLTLSSETLKQFEEISKEEFFSFLKAQHD